MILGANMKTVLIYQMCHNRIMFCMLYMLCNNAYHKKVADCSAEGILIWPVGVELTLIYQTCPSQIVFYEVFTMDIDVKSFIFYTLKTAHATTQHTEIMYIWNCGGYEGTWICEYKLILFSDEMSRFSRLCYHDTSSMARLLSKLKRWESSRM